MKDIKNYLAKFKKEIKKKEETNEVVYSQIKEIITKDFAGKEVLGYIKSFYLKNNTLFIETKNKIVAQELFWRSEKLKQNINEKKETVKRIIIK